MRRSPASHDGPEQAGATLRRLMRVVSSLDGRLARPHPVGAALGVLCFAVVLAAVALGVTFVVASGFGKTLSFTHIYPTIS